MSAAKTRHAVASSEYYIRAHDFWKLKAGQQKLKDISCMTKLFLFYFLQGARTRTKYQVNPDDIPGVVQFLIVFGQDFAHFLNPISDGVRGDFEFFAHIRGRIVLLHHLQAAVHRVK